MPGAGPGAKAPPQKVSAYLVSATVLPLTLESSGNLLAWNELQIMPEVGGKIVQLNIAEGTRVEKGNLLVKLFSEDLKAQAEKQELQLEIAKRNLNRFSDLVKINGVSQQEVDNAENQVNNIRSEINLIKAQLKKTEIFAPFSGVVGLTNASLGSYTSPGTAIASLQQMDELKIEFSIPEKYTQLLQTGDMVRFTVESQRDTFLARVYAFEPKIDPATRALKVRAKFGNQGRGLMPGSFAKVYLRLKDIRNAIMIPTESIIPQTRGKKVIVKRGGTAEFVSVETGIRNEDKVQILSGLTIGDTIVTTGLMFVKPKGEIVVTNLTR